MTKRQWRRNRGKIIKKFPGSARLRKVRFTSIVMEELTQALLFPQPRPEVDYWYD